MSRFFGKTFSKMSTAASNGAEASSFCACSDNVLKLMGVTLVMSIIVFLPLSLSLSVILTGILLMINIFRIIINLSSYEETAL